MTPRDLKQIDELFKKRLNLELERALKAHPTKQDLKKSNEVLIEDMGDLIKDFAEALNIKKADKATVSVLEDRVTIIEEKIAA